MLKNRFVLVGLFLFIVFMLYYAFSDTGTTVSADATNPEAYRKQVTTARAGKDQYFRTNSESPLPDKSGFSGLRYFEPALSYRVTARLEPFADKTQKFVARMSDGSEEVYDKFAHAVFSIDGETCRLLIVKLGDTYSILFRDVTTGKETYGGGRYLELEPADLTATQAILDFNKAYNPYCAYNLNYACPLPPSENTLSVAIRAGEQYIDHDNARK